MWGRVPKTTSTVTAFSNETGARKKQDVGLNGLSTEDEFLFTFNGKNFVKIMEGMRRVVSLAEEKGIRDKVRIFVGGAPISQSFCDEIGADVYTEDAGAAARAAVEILRSCQSSR